MEPFTFCVEEGLKITDTETGTVAHILGSVQIFGVSSRRNLERKYNNMPMSLGRRPATRFAALLGAALLFTSCSTASEAPVDEANSSEMSGSDEFPVTVDHAFGETTIAAEPQNIVALTSKEAETLLALDITPVGVASSYGTDSGVGSWADELLGDNEPTVWQGWDMDVSLEGIAALEPDLILNVFSDGDEQRYDELSKIAPTLALPEDTDPYNATMEETTSMIAQAVGQQEAGEALLSDLNAHISDLAAQHPEFEGKTAVNLDMNDENVIEYGANKFLNTILYDLGFEPTEKSLEVAEEEVAEGYQRHQVSPELLSEHDADIVLTYTWDRPLDEVITEVPGLSRLDSVANDNMIVLDNLAFSTASVVSVRYAIDDLVPQFAAALADDE